MLSGNLKIYIFPDFSCTHGRLYVFGRYAPKALVRLVSLISKIA